MNILKKVFFIAIIALANLSIAQKKYSISGYLKDAKNGEMLIGASVYIKELGTGATSNVYGFYSISIPEGKYTLNFNYIGYSSISKQIDLTTDLTLNIEFTEEGKQLEAVEVTSEREDANVKSIEMSVNKLDIKTIQKIPALLGEVDLIRAIQLLPGVTTVGEGASGFNVRGGAADQNLVLLDEAPVFNTSHLFGFFSVFNPDAVKDVKLIKGGIPAEYGGRLSSLLDIRMKEGNNKKLEVNGGVGVIFSRLAIEAPIVKDKGSFIIAGRRSYIDILAKPFLNEDLKESKFNFYDLTLKANYTLNDKNKIFLSGYFGRDEFGSNQFSFNWGNATGTLRWSHVFGEKLFLNTSLIYSNYDYTNTFGTNSRGTDSFEWNAKIINYSVKPEFSWFLNPDNTIKFGLISTYYNFVPGTAVAYSNGETRNFSLKDKFALESAAYISNEQRVGARTILQYGFRWSVYQFLGEGKSYYYSDGLDITGRKTLLSTKDHGVNDVIQSYNVPEPRFAIKYDLTETSSIKASYNRMAQYIHLVSNTTASTPLDVWTPSTNNIKPQISDQIALGYFRNFGKNNMYEASAETYYKDMQNQIDYVDGANLRLNEFIEGEVLTGVARAYGLELYVKKAKGKLTGWVSYTLARTERQVTGINRGEWYPNRFDKTHNLNVVVNYQLTPRFDVSATFTLMTGTPATFPTNRFAIQEYGNIPQNSFDQRNNYRIPAYHRLDLSATLYPKKKEGRKWEYFWVFSVYNVYNRDNPFSVYFRQNPDNANITEAVQFSVLARVIPAVSFNFKF